MHGIFYYLPKWEFDIGNFQKKERKKEEGLLVDVDVCFVTHVKWIDVAWRRPSKCGLIPSPPRSNNEDKRLLLNLSKKTSGERERERKRAFEELFAERRKAVSDGCKSSVRPTADDAGSYFQSLIVFFCLFVVFTTGHVARRH